MLYPGADYSECPQGQEVPQDECLAAANALTAGIPTISNRDNLLVNDWGGLPCGTTLIVIYMMSSSFSCADSDSIHSANQVASSGTTTRYVLIVPG